MKNKRNRGVIADVGQNIYPCELRYPGNGGTRQMPILTHLIAAVIGGIIGFLTAALLAANDNTDEQYWRARDGE